MDIVDDLRDLNSMHTPKEISDIGEKAADEIERLREALKIFADNVKETNVGIDKNWAETVYALKAENQRLRKDKTELLKALTDLHESCRWEKVCPTIDAAKDAIAKAIGEK